MNAQGKSLPPSSSPQDLNVDQISAYLFSPYPQLQGGETQKRAGTFTKHLLFFSVVLTASV